MRINPMNQSDIINAYMSNVTKVTPETKQAEGYTSDSIELSSGAKEYAQLVKSARETMSTSETQETERASEIMKQINSGTYNVSNEDVVRSIVSSALPYYG